MLSSKLSLRHWRGCRLVLAFVGIVLLVTLLLVARYLSIAYMWDFDSVIIPRTVSEDFARNGGQRAEQRIPKIVHQTWKNEQV
jgi:hypothetical protein